MSAATLVAPRSIEDAAAFVREASRERAVVLATGGGTKRTWTRPAARVDVELSTLRLSGVVAYEPGDGVVTALAGTTWAELESVVARHGHHLSPAVPDAQHATVGGVIAAGQSGVDRLRYGPVRDHVLGLRVVMADGAVVRSGGALVKNVTGFDLQRLHTGAHGTLGLVVEASLRLHAAPESRALALGFASTRAQALAIARDALASATAKPWAVIVHDLAPDGDARWVVAVLLAGRREQVADEVERLRAACLRLPVTTEDERGAAFAPTWDAVRATEGGRVLRHRLHVTTAPDRVDRTCAAIDALGAEAKLVIQPALGIVDACFRDLDAASARRIASALVSDGARLHWRGLGDELRAQVDLSGPSEPVGIALMRRIRANLDPRGTWAGGRLAGGL